MFGCFHKIIFHRVWTLFATINYSVFSVSMIVLDFTSLSKKKGFIAFQNILLTDTFLISRLLKYSLFALHNVFKPFLFFIVTPVIFRCLPLNLFLSLDHVITTFLRVLHMNWFWSKCKIIFLIGAELLDISQKTRGT